MVTFAFVLSVTEPLVKISSLFSVLIVKAFRAVKELSFILKVVAPEVIMVISWSVLKVVIAVPRRTAFILPTLPLVVALSV